MIDQQQIIQMLQGLQQKNNQGMGVGGGVPSQQPQQQAPQGQAMQRQQGNSPSMLGFLGGLGDTTNAQGNIDPSWLTQMNQGLMKQTGQQGIEGALPWQPQTTGQQLGQSTGGGLMKFLSLLM